MYFQRFEDLRIDADKTQQEIADLLHMQREVYRRYEKGIYDFPVWAVIQLAQYYGVTTDYLLGLSDERSFAPRVVFRPDPSRGVQKGAREPRFPCPLLESPHPSCPRPTHFCRQKCYPAIQRVWIYVEKDFLFR